MPDQAPPCHRFSSVIFMMPASLSCSRKRRQCVTRSIQALWIQISTKNCSFHVDADSKNNGNKKDIGNKTYKEATSHLAQNGISSGLGSSLRILTGHVAWICKNRFEVKSVNGVRYSFRITALKIMKEPTNFQAASTNVGNHGQRKNLFLHSCSRDCFQKRLGPPCRIIDTYVHVLKLRLYMYVQYEIKHSSGYKKN